MEKIKKNFGFGCMRLPMNGDKVDTAQFAVMVDKFIDSGFNYFDTAHGYLNGQSEVAVRECLTSRYPRDAYVLTDKLSGFMFEKKEDIRKAFGEQLEICGVDYFDFYLMHCQHAGNYGKFCECEAYETAYELKKEGKIRHLGFSFHDNAELLDRILTEKPFIEVVQLQVNYLDYEDVNVQSRKCLEVCKKHGKKVIVMEPVKGGSLVFIPDDAKKIFASLGSASAASYALRFAAGCDGVFMVLSGMSDIAQVDDNVNTMKDFAPLNEEETKAVNDVCGVIKGLSISCTACRYCTDGCPMKIEIPRIFAAVNAEKVFGQNGKARYEHIISSGSGKASECIKCGQCEDACPQKLPIRDLLEKAAEKFE